LARTKRIRCGRKTNEIAEIGIMDEKNKIHNFGRNLDEKWPTDRRKTLSNSLTFFGILYHNAFTVGLR